MAQEITLDAIIRRSLGMRKLPLHYYLPVLLLAKRGLEDMHFHTLQKIKVVTINLDPTLRTGTLPEDFVEEVMVGVEEGDKIRPLAYNPKLNRRDDGGTPFPEAKLEDYNVFAGTTNLIGHEGSYNEYGDYKGRNFGRTASSPDSYIVIPELNKIRVDYDSDIQSIQLAYLTLPAKVSNKSVIHPLAQTALYAWIDWQWAVYNKEKDQELRRRDYFNALRVLRASKNKMTTTEIKRIFRRSIKLTIKN
jgi:hypothetical protein